MWWIIEQINPFSLKAWSILVQTHYAKIQLSGKCSKAGKGESNEKKGMISSKVDRLSCSGDGAPMEELKVQIRDKSLRKKCFCVVLKVKNDLTALKSIKQKTKLTKHQGLSFPICINTFFLCFFFSFVCISFCCGKTRVGISFCFLFSNLSWSIGQFSIIQSFEKISGKLEILSWTSSDVLMPRKLTISWGLLHK